MKRILRWCARFCAAICLILIVPLTAAAFWVFNANQVLFNPDTYQTALHTPFAEGQIFNALLNGLAGSAPRDALDVIHRTSGPTADLIQNQLFPPGYADPLVDNIITALRDWLAGKTDIPRLTVDLTPLKSNLTGNPAKHLAGLLADDLPPCTFSQMSILAAFSQSQSGSFKEFPLCSPTTQSFPTPVASPLATATPAVPGQTSAGKTATPASGSQSPTNPAHEAWTAGFTTALTLIASKLPDSWSLGDQISPLNGSAADPGKVTVAQLNVIRASIWLQQRLLVMLFLIPIGLLCIVVILTIRTTKRLLRWSGWVLVISGIVSLLPVILFSTSFIADQAHLQPFTGSGLTVDQLAFNAVVRGAVQSVISALSLVILIQVAILIVIGLLALILSIIVSPPLYWPPDDLVSTRTPNFVPK